MNKRSSTSRSLKSASFMVIYLLSFFSVAQENALTFQQDIDYQLVKKGDITNVEQLSDLESVANIEFFYWFGCESCFQVEAALSKYLELNPELTIRRVPVVARTAWRQQAYIQALMEQIARTTTAPSYLDIYRQCLTDCSTFTDIDSTKSWIFTQLDSEELPSIDLVQIWQREKSFQKRADFYSIKQVPTIIINETYQVDANRAQTTKRLLEIIDFLLQKNNKE